MSDIVRIMKRAALDKSFSEINRYIENLENENAKLRETVRSYSKDEHIDKIENELTNVKHNAVHIFEDKEYQDYRAFNEKHYDKCRLSSSEIIVLGTGIGNVVKVRCDICEEVKDITDYDNF